MTRENYDRLSVGMTCQEVVDILGGPEECESVRNAKNCTWEDAAKDISVKFVADKAVFFLARV